MIVCNPFHLGDLPILWNLQCYMYRCNSLWIVKESYSLSWYQSTKSDLIHLLPLFISFLLHLFVSSLMAATNERCFGVTNIKHHIPLILDLKDHNYDAWRELFQNSLHEFWCVRPYRQHSPPNRWCRHGVAQTGRPCQTLDLRILAQPMFRSSFKTGRSARDIWLRVENQFKNNKEARAIQLDNKIRTMEIGDMTVREYCQKLKSVADLLSMSMLLSMNEHWWCIFWMALMKSLITLSTLSNTKNPSPRLNLLSQCWN